MTGHFIDFNIEIFASPSDSAYLVHAESSLSGSGYAELRLDLTDYGLHRDLAALVNHTISQPALIALGRRLFAAIFHGEIAEGYRKILSNEPVRLRLHSKEIAIMALPWELLYDEEFYGGSFLALSLKRPIVRYVQYTSPDRIMLHDRPWRILVVAASPTDLQPINLNDECRQIEQVLNESSHSVRVTLQTIQHATKQKLLENLRSGCDVLHFIGHDSLIADSGAIYLEDNCACSSALLAEELSNLLADSGVIAVVLNTCHAADADVYQSIWGIAPRLIRSGIPLVVGMRGQVEDRSSIIFANEFYKSLAIGWPLTVAMAHGRKALMLEKGIDQPAWSQPVLFASVHDVYRPDQTGQTIDQIVRMALSMPDLPAETRLKSLLGAQIELMAPISVAIMGAPIFRWALGEDALQACKDAVEITGTLLTLNYQVSILNGTIAVWKSAQEQLAITVPFDMASEAEKASELTCPEEFYTQLQAGCKYRWELVVTIPLIDFRGRLNSKTLRQQAPFRVLSQQEQEQLQMLLVSLPIVMGEDAECYLLRGAIYDSFGLYDLAVDTYQQALKSKSLHNQIYGRLADLYNKRAYELLGLADEQPCSTPIASFVAQANHYRSLAVSPS